MSDRAEVTKPARLVRRALSYPVALVVAITDAVRDAWPIAASSFRHSFRTIIEGNR